MSEDWRRAAAGLAVDGEWTGATALSTGHIHQSWLATCREATGDRRYLLQSINTRIFRDPAVLMDNIVRVTGHLRRALERRGVADLERAVLQVVPGRDGRPWVDAGPSGCWRAYAYIEGTRHFDTAESVDVAREAGRVFGEFVASLSDWSGPAPAETIANFHDFDGRVRDLETAVARDVAGRLASVGDDVEATLTAVRDLLAELDGAGRRDWPVRLVHNDCKLNNVLFDAASGRGLCAVDLDTVMPGHVAYDLGGLVRTATCPAPEDETDLARIVFDRARFAGCVDGYLSGAGDLLTSAECGAFHLAGPLMTLEDAIRFLTDHLAGDVYFAVHRPDHNLDRARSQRALFERMWEVRAEARREVERIRSAISPRSR